MVSFASRICFFFYLFTDALQKRFLSLHTELLYLTLFQNRTSPAPRGVPTEEFAMIAKSVTVSDITWVDFAIDPFVILIA